MWVIGGSARVPCHRGDQAESSSSNYLDFWTPSSNLLSYSDHCCFCGRHVAKFRAVQNTRCVIPDCTRHSLPFINYFQFINLIFLIHLVLDTRALHQAQTNPTHSARAYSPCIALTIFTRPLNRPMRRKQRQHSHSQHTQGPSDSTHKKRGTCPEPQELTTTRSRPGPNSEILPNKRIIHSATSPLPSPDPYHSRSRIGEPSPTLTRDCHLHLHFC